MFFIFTINSKLYPMRKIILFTALTLVFASCSSNDDISTDSLAGVWKITQNVYNNEEIPLRTCQENDFIEMFSNNTFNSEYYEEINGDCVNNDDSQGTWKYVSGNNYNIIVGTKKVSLTLLDKNTFKTFENENDLSSYEVYKLQ